MPFGLVGSFVAGKVGSALAGSFIKKASGSVSNKQVLLTLTHDGRKIKRLLRKVDKDSKKSALRATNRTGKWAGTQVKRHLVKIVNIKLKELGYKEYRAGPRQRIPTYRLRIYRRHYKVEKLKGTRFKTNNYRRNVGTLRFTAYGKKQVFRDIIKIKGRFYFSNRGNAKNKYLKRVFGTMIKRNYIEPMEVKKQIPKRWVVEFNRQMLLLKNKRKVIR